MERIIFKPWVSHTKGGCVAGRGDSRSLHGDGHRHWGVTYTYSQSQGSRRSKLVT